VGTTAGPVVVGGTATPSSFVTPGAVGFTLATAVPGALALEAPVGRDDGATPVTVGAPLVFAVSVPAVCVLAAVPGATGSMPGSVRSLVP
jgi:hypothetical protein